MKDVFRVRRMWRPRSRAEGSLRRRDHRRRRARARDRLLPCEEPRHHATSPCSSSPTSARARPGATRRSSARTTARRREPPSTSASVELYERLSGELDFNLMFSQHGHLTLAHTDSSLRVMQERAEVNQILGIDSAVVYPEEIGSSARSSTSPRSRRGRSWAPSTTRRAESSGTTPSSGASRAAPTAPASSCTRTPPVTGIET